MPLPMMALLRLNTDIPNDVFPSNYRHQSGMERRGESAQGGCTVVYVPRRLPVYQSTSSPRPISPQSPNSLRLPSSHR